MNKKKYIDPVLTLRVSKTNRNELKSFLQDISYNLPSIRKSQKINFDFSELKQHQQEQLFSFQCQIGESEDKLLDHMFNSNDELFKKCNQQQITKEQTIYFLRKKVQNYYNLISLEKLKIYDLKNLKIKFQKENKIEPIVQPISRKNSKEKNIIEYIQSGIKQKLKNEYSPQLGHQSILAQKLNIKHADENNKLEIMSHIHEKFDNQMNLKTQNILDLKEMISQCDLQVNNIFDEIIIIKKNIKFYQAEKFNILKQKLLKVQNSDGIDSTLEQFKDLDQKHLNYTFPQFLDQKMLQFINYKTQVQNKIKSYEIIQQFTLQNFAIQKSQGYQNNSLIQLFENNNKIYETKSKNDFITQYEILKNKITKVIYQFQHNLILSQKSSQIIKHIKKLFQFTNYQEQYNIEIKYLIQLIFGLQQYQKINLKYNISF